MISARPGGPARLVADTSTTVEKIGSESATALVLHR